MQHADEIHSAFLNTRSGQKSLCRGKCDKSQLGHKFRAGEGGCLGSSMKLYQQTRPMAYFLNPIGLKVSSQSAK